MVLELVAGYIGYLIGQAKCDKQKGSDEANLISQTFNDSLKYEQIISDSLKEERQENAEQFVHKDSLPNFEEINALLKKHDDNITKIQDDYLKKGDFKSLESSVSSLADSVNQLNEDKSKYAISDNVNSLIETQNNRLSKVELGQQKTNIAFKVDDYLSAKCSEQDIIELTYNSFIGGNPTIDLKGKANAVKVLLNRNSSDELFRSDSDSLAINFAVNSYLLSEDLFIHENIKNGAIEKPSEIPNKIKIKNLNVYTLSAFEETYASLSELGNLLNNDWNSVEFFNSRLELLDFYKNNFENSTNELEDYHEDITGAIENYEQELISAGSPENIAKSIADYDRKKYRLEDIEDYNNQRQELSDVFNSKQEIKPLAKWNKEGNTNFSLYADCSYGQEFLSSGFDVSIAENKKGNFGLGWRSGVTYNTNGSNEENIVETKLIENSNIINSVENSYTKSEATNISVFTGPFASLEFRNKEDKKKFELSLALLSNWGFTNTDYSAITSIYSNDGQEIFTKINPGLKGGSKTEHEFKSELRGTYYPFTNTGFYIGGVIGGDKYIKAGATFDF